ncbi:MAG: hypothetical protein LUI07_07420 [Lachnospiraceae bacterium]|nr:hypothetical protein [Lachnospiraceae bacterium]
MKAIGIDLGTTTISAVVMDEATGKTEAAYTLSNDSFLHSGHPWEKLQDPERIVEKATELLDGVLARPEYAETIRVIGLTGQMHGIVYLDRDGRHVSPLFTWQDERGNDKCFGGKSLCEILEQQYGISASTGYGLVTHLYNAATGRVPEGAVTVCTIMDYLGMVLTGRKKPLVHTSNAAGFGFFDVEHGTFRKELFSQVRISEKELSGVSGLAAQQMKLSGDIFPEVTAAPAILGTWKGIPVCVAIGDNQASFLGSVSDLRDSVLVNMGTGSQVSVYVKDYICVKGIETRPFLKGGYLLVGSSLCGGRAYSLLERFFHQYAEALHVTEPEQYSVMERLLRSYDEDAPRLKVDTRFAGTRDEPERRGKIENIGIDNFTPGALIYGVLDGMAEELYQMYLRMADGLRPPRTKIVASGNGMRKNVFLQEITARRFGMELRLTEQKEEAACGAAKAARLV